MTKEHALSLENAVVDGGTIYRIYASDKKFLYSPDAEFLADCAKLAALDTSYRVSILAEEDAQKFLKKHSSFLKEHHLSQDPAEVAVVSYTYQ